MRIMVFMGMISLGVLVYPQAPDTNTLPVLNRGIEELQLGRTLEAIQEALKKSPSFSYRGPKDVFFLPLRPEPVIDTEGMRYLKRGIFQFQEGRLVTIILYVNPKYLDYPTLFQHFNSRYGAPQYLDPKSCFWEDRDTRLALEKPLTIKFVDRNILPPGKDGGEGLPLSPEELGRRQFLELF